MLSGVIALSEPTSSSLPQTQPQPLPFCQPFIPGFSCCSSETTRPGNERPSSKTMTKARSKQAQRKQRMVWSPWDKGCDGDGADCTLGSREGTREVGWRVDRRKDPRNGNAKKKKAAGLQLSPAAFGLCVCTNRCPWRWAAS